MNFDDLTLEEIAQRKAELCERRDSMLAEVETVEEADRESFEARLEELDQEERSLTERETALLQAAEEREARIAEVRGSGKVKIKFEGRKEMTDLEIRSSHEYNVAYAEYLKTGEDKECRALLSDNVETGTVPVATYVEDRIRTAWERDGIIARVRKTYMKGNVTIGWEKSADEAYQHTEGSGAVTEESLVLGTTKLVGESLKKWISVSDEALDLKGEAFLDYIVDELVYRVAKKAADVLIGKIKACTSVSTNDAPAVNSITATTINVGLIAQAMAELSDEATDLVAIMNKKTWGAFKAAQAANNYGYDPFEGLPVLYNNKMAAFSAATTGVPYVIVGDLGLGAQINFPSGDDEVQIKIDDTTNMTSDLVRVLGRKYAGIGVVAPNAFAMIKH